jgi:hypothetical protein
VRLNSSSGLVLKEATVQTRAALQWRVAGGVDVVSIQGRIDEPKKEISK